MSTKPMAPPPYVRQSNEAPVTVAEAPAAVSTKDELLSIAAEIGAVGSAIPYPEVTESREHSTRLHVAVERLRKVAEGL